jgi:hypothetical protein
MTNGCMTAILRKLVLHQYVCHIRVAGSYVGICPVQIVKLAESCIHSSTEIDVMW